MLQQQHWLLLLSSSPTAACPREEVVVAFFEGSSVRAGFVVLLRMLSAAVTDGTDAAWARSNKSDEYVFLALAEEQRRRLAATAMRPRAIRRLHGTLGAAAGQIDVSFCLVLKSQSNVKNKESYPLDIIFEGTAWRFPLSHSLPTRWKTYALKH